MSRTLLAVTVAVFSMFSCTTRPTQSGPLFPGAGTDPSAAELSASRTQCFFAPTSSGPAATVQYRLEAFQGVNTVHLRLTLDPSFVDNTYGANALGWGSAKNGQHTWRDLVGSDHAQLAVDDGTGHPVLELKTDYISLDPTRPSGYGSLGVRGGDGRMLLGAASAVVAATSSLDRNLNERGHVLTVDSPATDAKYSPNAAAPDWDYRVVYDVWVLNDALGPSGFGGVRLPFVHASPSKSGTNTVYVVPRDCPPGWVDESCAAGGSGCPPSSVPPLLEDPGGSCTQAAQCRSGVCQMGRCGRGPDGAACLSSGDCADGQCLAEGVCGTPTNVGGAGAPCTGAAGCASESCVRGICEGSGTGFPCTTGADCQQGFTCQAGYCSGIN